MKNILFFHTGAELYGADIVLLTLLKHLDKQEYNPIVVLPSTGPLQQKLIEENITVYVIPYPILRRQYFSPKGLFDYIRNYFSSCNIILNMVSEKDINIIHVNTIAVLEGIYISRRLKKPLIWHVHEILEHPRIVYKVTCALIGKFATRIIAVSDAVKTHICRSGFIKKEKVEVIYNGVDTEVFNPQNSIAALREELNIPEESFVIGMIGRVNAIKGQDDFIKIVTPLIKKYPNVYALIIGDAFPGQEWRIEMLNKAILASNTNGKLKYLGYRTDTNRLHCLFDVYMLPSVHSDSLPTVVLESMASHKVVVGYRNGGIVEMVKDRETGYLEDIGNMEGLRDDIELLIIDIDRYNAMSQKGYERQKDLFSLDSFISQVECLYDEV